jgi:hypothetical protein
MGPRDYLEGSSLDPLTPLHPEFLMIILLVVGTLLIPLFPIIFATDLLADHRIGHIEKPKEKASEMGEVSHSASCSSQRGEEFDQPEEDDEVFGRDGKEKVEVDETIWKKPAKGEEDPVNRPRSTDDRDELVGGEKDRQDTRPNTTEEKVEREFPRTPIALKLPSKHPEPQKIEEKMRDAPVKEDVSEELPDKSLLPDANRDQAQILTEMPARHVRHHLQEEDPRHDKHQFLDDRGQPIPKRESGAIIGHDIVLSDLAG